MGVWFSLISVSSFATLLKGNWKPDIREDCLSLMSVFIKTNYLIEINSISNISVEFGPISGPAACGP